MDYKFELVMIPVTDVDRAKHFYAEQAGFQLDVDTMVNPEMRVVQLTPPGSACSIVFGTGMSEMPPGSIQGMHLVVTDIDAAYKELHGRSVGVSEVRHLVDGVWKAGAHPHHMDYNSFSEFKDPDGNGWILQERGYERR